MNCQGDELRFVELDIGFNCKRVPWDLHDFSEKKTVISTTVLISPLFVLGKFVAVAEL